MSNASAIRAGKAVVEIGLKDNVRAGLNAMSKRLSDFAGTVNALGISFAGVGTAILGGLGGAGVAFAKAGSEVADLSARTGVGVEALQALLFAARQSGASAEDLEAALRNLSKTITRADEDSVSAADALARLGISTDALVGMAPDAAFRSIADALASIDDPAQRSTAAMAVFGKSGTKIIPMLARGSRGLDDFAARAKALGIVLSDDAVKLADELGDKLDEVQDALRGAANAAGAALAPAMVKALDAVSSVVGAFSKFLADNPRAVKDLALIAGGAAAVGAALTAAGVAMAGLVSVGGALFAVMGSPLGMIATALGGITAATIGLTTNIEDLAERGAKAFRALGDDAEKTFKAILDALKNSDWQGAAEIAAAGVALAFERAFGEIRKGLESIRTEVAVGTSDASISGYLGKRLDEAVSGNLFGEDQSLFGLIDVPNIWGEDKKAFGVDLRKAVIGLDANAQGLGKAIDERTKLENQAMRDSLTKIDATISSGIDAGVQRAADALEKAIADSASRVASNRLADNGLAEFDAALRAVAEGAFPSDGWTVKGDGMDFGPGLSEYAAKLQQMAADIPAVLEAATSAISPRGTFFAGDAALMGGGSVGAIERISDRAEKIYAELREIKRNTGQSEDGIGP
ncbi:MAG: phage tail tape measure protein [Phycisphaerales bacterium]|nr:phage tail tape measure protein [Phycisphaerales bacterium]